MNRNLLIIGSSLNYGSPGHITENIGKAAIDQGWTVYQAHGLRYSRPSKLKTYAVSSKFGEWRHFTMSLLLDGHGLSSKRETENLVRWIEKINPDVINLHNLHGYYLNYEILFKFLANLNKPIVWTIHDFWPITGHCTHFDYIKCNKWQNLCFKCPQKRSYPKSFIDRSQRNFELKKALFTSIENMKIVTVSNWVKSIYKQSFLNGYPIHTIYNGVDLDIFKYSQSALRQQLNLENKYVLLGVASPWYHLKGYNDYIKLSKILPKDCVIIMIGLNKNQIKSLPPNIIGMERTDCQENLVKFYSMADVVLNLSYQETFGMTTIEGMACGTPSIVYDRTASPELITKDTGLIVQAGNIYEIKNAIDILKNKNQIKPSKACIDYVKANFNFEKQVDKYIQLFNSVIE